MTPVVRAAVVTDARRIEEIRVAGWHAAYDGLIDSAWLGQLTVTEERVATWEQRLAEPAPDAVTLMSEAGHNAVGFAGLLPSRDDDLPEAFELLALYVDPAHWHGGHGSALLTAGFAGRPTTVHILWVLEGNVQARRFYERHGFATDGARKQLEVPGRPAEVRYRRAHLG